MNRNEKMLACLIAVSAIAAFHRIAVLPWKTRAAELRQNIQAAQAKLATDQNTYDNLKKQMAAASRPSLHQPLLTEFDRSNDRFSKIVTDLARETRSAPLRLRRLATEKPSSSNEYTQVVVSLDVDASFPEIGKFLEKLGDLPMLTEVDSLEIYRVENDLKKCSARIRLLSYLVKP